MPGDLPLRTVATPMGISGHAASGDLAAQRRPSARLAEPDTLPVKGPDANVSCKKTDPIDRRRR